MAPSPYSLVPEVIAIQDIVDESDSESDDGLIVRTKLTPELEQVALKELNECEKDRQLLLDEFRSWVVTQPELARCRLDDSFLLRFLRAQKFNVKLAGAVLAKYFQLRCDAPHWFRNLDPSWPSIYELTGQGFVFVLPERDPEGRRVIFNNVASFDPSRFNNGDVMRTFMATLETLLEDEENQIRGITYIIHCKGMTLSHAAIWTPSDAALLFRHCEKTLPIRHRDINLVGLPFTLWAVMEFSKSLLSSKIKERITIFSDEAKLARKVNEAILPKEMGGSVPMRVMAGQWRDKVVANRRRLLALDDMDLPVPEVPRDTVLDEDVDVTPLISLSSRLWALIPGRK